MEPNAFVGKKSKPTESQLALVLGPSKSLWDQIIEELSNECPTQQWSSYSVKAGWSLKLKRKDRTILYLSPYAEGFRASFVLGDKAVRATRDAGLSRAVLKLIAEAKKYAEGTGIRVDVTSAADVEDVKNLATIKLAN
jgi:hypothetical protein